MHINGINGFNNIHLVKAECKSVMQALVKLRYKPSYDRIEQEKNRIILRSHGVKYLMKTFFGKGNFDWKDPYEVTKLAYGLLEEYPLPPEVWQYQEIREGAWIYKGIKGIWLKVSPVELKAKPDDPLPILEAKREAFCTNVAHFYERGAWGRPPNWRVLYGDEVNRYYAGEKEDFPPWAGKEFYGWVWKDPENYDKTLGILETHKPYCPAPVWEVIDEYIFKPELPFDVELPDFGKIKKK
ncbi:MAG: hypothetical protein ACPL4K_02385 [Candidatus Margulisiibacteriota bacterium]